MSKKIVCLTSEVDAQMRALAPCATSGLQAGKPSPVLFVREAIALGELARGLVPRGELPWATLRALVQERLDQRAPRRVRT